MKGFQIQNIKIGIDYSGNFTRGVVINTNTGEVVEGNLSDFYFDEQIEKNFAENTRNLIIESPEPTND